MQTRIVILGGGFAGLGVARHLDRLFRGDRSVAITLVNRDNYFLFTPMLPEVAGSGIEAKHVVSPLRAFCRAVAFRTSEVVGIDLAARTIITAHAVSGRPYALPFDHLVLAVGAVAGFRGLPGVAEHALTFKGLGDAMVVRNHLIDLFEQADLEEHIDRRRMLLTVVVSGAGFSGVELAGELADLCRAAARYYPRIQAGEARLMVVHPGQRILPEIGPELADYALNKLRARGVEVLLETAVRAAGPDWVETDTGRRIPTSTLIWTAGTTPSPVLAALPVEQDRRGAVIVDEHLEVPGYPGVWALGDCALVRDPLTGTPYPPTAQHATREAKVLAENLAATIRGGTKRPFHFRSPGMFVALGHRSAVAEIRGHRFSGFPAWWLWRTVYLAKLPRLERKMRVALDWTLDLLFPRDFTQMRPFQERALPIPGRAEPAMPAIAAALWGEEKSMSREDEEVPL